MERESAASISGRVSIVLKLHSGVQALEDEWSGVSNPLNRRKLQNRLNQRAHRRRKAAQKKGETIVAGPYDATDLQLARRLTEDSPLSPLLALCATERGASDRTEIPHQSVIDQFPKQVDEFEKTSNHNASTIKDVKQCSVAEQVSRLRHLHQLIIQSTTLFQPRSAYSLPADHLLSLVYYNVYRGLVINIALLGLSHDLMCTDDYVSPFLLGDVEDDDDNLYLKRLPPSLQPTILQRTIPHHPQLDLFPDPVLRDNAIALGDDNFDDIELCLNIFGQGLVLAEETTTAENDVQVHAGLFSGASLGIWPTGR